jgi:hypothetical protein
MIRIFAWLAPAVLTGIVSRILFAIGVSWLTFTGLDALASWVVSEFKGTINGLPQLFLQLAGVAKLDVVVNLFVSATNISLVFFVAKRLRIL